MLLGRGYSHAGKTSNAHVKGPVPADIVARLVAGDEHPIKVWREFRGMTQAGLADQAGVSQGQVALIEGGKRQGTVDVLKGLPRVLNVELDHLV